MDDFLTNADPNLGVPYPQSKVNSAVLSDFLILVGKHAPTAGETLIDYYKRVAILTHPDKTGTDTEFKILNEAKALLLSKFKNKVPVSKIIDYIKDRNRRQAAAAGGGASSSSRAPPPPAASGYGGAGSASRPPPPPAASNYGGGRWSNAGSNYGGGGAGSASRAPPPPPPAAAPAAAADYSTPVKVSRFPGRQPTAPGSGLAGDQASRLQAEDFWRGQASKKAYGILEPTEEELAEAAAQQENAAGAARAAPILEKQAANQAAALKEKEEAASMELYGTPTPPALPEYELLKLVVATAAGRYRAKAEETTAADAAIARANAALGAGLSSSRFRTGNSSGRPSGGAGVGAVAAARANTWLPADPRAVRPLMGTTDYEYSLFMKKQFWDELVDAKCNPAKKESFRQYGRPGDTFDSFYERVKRFRQDQSLDAEEPGSCTAFGGHRRSKKRAQRKRRVTRNRSTKFVKTK
jgi:hypothetical protein